MPSISPTAKSILTLLNNVNDLIVESSDREDAKEVMKAIRTYAENKRFELPQQKIENFLAILIDSRPYTLTNILMDIASDVVSSNQH